MSYIYILGTCPFTGGRCVVPPYLYSIPEGWIQLERAFCVFVATLGSASWLESCPKSSLFMPAGQLHVEDVCTVVYWNCISIADIKTVTNWFLNSDNKQPSYTLILAESCLLILFPTCLRPLKEFVKSRDTKQECFNTLVKSFTAQILSVNKNAI